MRYGTIISTSHYLPEIKVHNDELRQRFQQTLPDFVNTMEERSGIRQRWHAPADWATSDVALPAAKLAVEYELEYGSHTLEMHADGIVPGQRALIVDDLLATGGTCGAAVNLVERLGGIVTGGAFLVELDFLHGREKLAGYDVRSVVRF